MLPDRRRVSVDNGAEAYLRVFDHHGVDYFFNSPGSEDTPFWDALAKLTAQARETGREPPVRHVNCRHEAVAVTMAAGYAMVTGSPQVVKLHVNTGPLHAAMELYGAYHSSVPLVVLSSYDSTHENELAGGTGGPHYLDFQHPGGHENFFSRYTKWVADVKTNENAERVLSRAFRIARSEPPGPVFVNAREELLHDTAKDQVTFVENETTAPLAPDRRTLDRIATRLNDADNPLLLTSRCGRTPGVTAELVALAERLQVPVAETDKWHFNFPMDHPLYLGSIGGERFETLVEDVDLLVVVDAEKPWYPPESGAPADTDVIMLHPEPLQEKKSYWNYPADVLVAADSTRVLSTLVERVDEYGGTRPGDWERVHRRWRDRWRDRALAGEGSTPIDPFWLCYQLDDLLPGDAIVCNETIVHSSLVSNLVTDGEDRLYVDAAKANGGGLGSGLGLTLGAKLTDPDRVAVTLLGDGGFNYNPVPAAFGAAQEYDLPILAVIFDNGQYKSMHRNLQRDFPDGWATQTETYFGSDIQPRPEYARQVEAWGGHGETVEDPSDLRPALQDGLAAVADGQSAIVDVVVEESSPGTPALD